MIQNPIICVKNKMLFFENITLKNARKYLKYFFLLNHAHPLALLMDFLECCGAFFFLFWSGGGGAWRTGGV